MAAKKSGSRKKIWRGILILMAVLLAGGGIVGYKYYSMIFTVNVDLGERESIVFYIPTGTDFDGLLGLMRDEKILRDESSFVWLSEKKAYTRAVKAGKYLITDGMTNNALINMLRSGRQEPVKLILNNIRTRDVIARKAGELLETDSASIMQLMDNETFTREKYGMNREEVMCLFIPNTYEFYWNTSAEEFLDRMFKEYNKFWNEERKQKAADMDLSPVQVTILASIVYQETKKTDEFPKIAGVYMNRMKTGMYLQACPTVIFALGDFTIKRLLKRHLDFESPYNTYLHEGLPPGPICLPPPEAIDGTLNYEKHDYLFFSAREDFSGYHRFAKTNAQHEQNAALYHAALNKEIQKKKKAGS